eukprot:4539114-Prymnesium_polylepis.2
MTSAPDHAAFKNCGQGSSLDMMWTGQPCKRAPATARRTPLSSPKSATTTWHDSGCSACRLRQLVLRQRIVPRACGSCGPSDGVDYSGTITTCEL